MAARILGIGIDVVETARIRRLLDGHGERFERRTFTDAEIAYCRASKFPEQLFGARFAAKEAVAKAFGTGIGAQLGWKDIEVVRLESGEPTVELSPGGAEFARARRVCQIMISLTHTHEYAAANAVILCSDA